MADINTQQDLLRLLRDDSEFKEEVRRIILTEELLNVTPRLDRIEGTLLHLTNTVGELTNTVGELTNTVGELTNKMGELTNTVGELTDLLGDVKGDTVELKLEKSIVPILSTRLELRRGSLVKGGAPTAAAHEFEDAIYDAYEEGKLTQRERSRVNDTDAIVRAVNRISKCPVYVAVEASYAIDDEDVKRAHRTAEILARVFTDAEVVPVVYGKTIDSLASTAAEDLDVAVYQTV